MKMRNEADISTLLTLQWGFRIIFKQRMTICLHTRGLMVVVAVTEQGVRGIVGQVENLQSQTHT